MRERTLGSFLITTRRLCFANTSQSLRRQAKTAATARLQKKITKLRKFGKSFCKEKKNLSELFEKLDKFTLFRGLSIFNFVLS